MKILMVNKFLYPKGGAETYVLKLGKILEEQGHEVQYFGLSDEKNIVGNGAKAYVSPMDFQKGIKGNLRAPFKIIYSREARLKIRRVLDDFKPDVIHFNNIQFHLSPSIILEAHDYRAKTGQKLEIVYTAHDYQLICPSHGLFDNQMQICERCLGGNYTHCLRTKCVKNSYMRSLLGMLDAYYWKTSKAYDYIDTIICPSAFLKTKLDTQKRLMNKTVIINNFVDRVQGKSERKENYVIEFGKLCKDKGTNTLLEVCKKMPDIQFVFVGYGPAKKDIEGIKNAKYLGFKTDEELESLIRNAKCSIYPSEWYENCPFSVIESQVYETPVLASRIGGIPELIQEGKTGELFTAGDVNDLESKLRKLLETPGRLDEYSQNCKKANWETPESYYTKLMKIYKGNEDV